MPAPRSIQARHIVDGLDCRKLGGNTRDRRTPISRATFSYWRKELGFPKPFKKTGSGTELFDLLEVRAWLEEYEKTMRRFDD